MDNRSLTCILLRISEEIKGYRLFDPIANKVIVSRDVFFEEDKEWDWGADYQEQVLLDLEWGEQHEKINEK